MADFGGRVAGALQRAVTAVLTGVAGGLVAVGIVEACAGPWLDTLGQGALGGAAGGFVMAVLLGVRRFRKRRGGGG